MIIHNPTVQRDANGNRTVVMVDLEVPDPTPSQLNEATLRDRAATALATNDTFLALGNTATAAQVRDQTRALTRQVNALIRLTLGALDTIDDA